MALAVAGALAAPAALAQVQIGGGIHLQYFNHDPDNDLASSSHDNLRTSEPEIYVRGEEKLGGGLSVWFQCTSSMEVLGPASSSWCGRNSAIGFRGGFGNVFFGNWDTPHKLVTNLARGWWGGTNTLQGGTATILYNDSQTGANNGSSFFRRHSRSINFHSPDWSGFNLQAAFSSQNEATDIPDADPAKPRMMSVAGQFRTGPFFAGLGYEKHTDFGGAGVETDDNSMNLAVGFTFAGAVRVSALYATVEYDTAGVKTEHDGYAVYVDWSLGGPHKLYFQWGMRNETEVGGVEIADSSVDVLGVAYGYSFSKRTQGYIAYNSMSNDPAAAFDQGTADAAPGGKQKSVGVGLRHSF
jgi:predicted porin